MFISKIIHLVDQVIAISHNIIIQTKIILLQILILQLSKESMILCCSRIVEACFYYSVVELTQTYTAHKKLGEMHIL